MPDPAHRRHNDFVDGVNAARLKWVRHQALLTLNIGTAPWKGCAHFAKYSEAAQEYFSSFTTKDELFQEFYLPLSCDRHAGVLLETYGSPEHQQHIWDWCIASKLVSNVGEGAKSGRWFQWPRRWRTFEPYKSLLLLLLTYMGIHLGWWPSLQESPLSRRRAGGSQAQSTTLPADGENRGAADTGAAVGSAGAVHGPPKKSVELSNLAVDKAAATRNSLFLVAESLGAGFAPALATGAAGITAPMDRVHGQSVTMAKTPEGCQQWHIAMAAGHHPYLNEMGNALQCQGLFCRMGLWPSAAGTSHCVLSDLDSRDMCGSLVDYLCDVLGREILFCATYCMSPPCSRFALLSDDGRTVSASLAHHEALWAALSVAEDHSSRDLWLRQWLSSMLWPLAVWPRELLLGLRECSFLHCPPDLRHELSLAASGPGGTKDIEDNFNLLRRLSKVSGNGSMSVQTQWHREVTSGMLPDSGKPLLQAEGADQVVGDADLQASTFRATACDFSLGAAALDEFMTESSWPSPSPQSWMQIPVATAALVAHRGRLATLPLLFQSMVAVQGSVLVHIDGLVGSEAWWVLDRTPSGVVVWPLETYTLNGFTWASLKHVDDVRTAFIHIADHKV